MNKMVSSCLTQIICLLLNFLCKEQSILQTNYKWRKEKENKVVNKVAKQIQKRSEKKEK